MADLFDMKRNIEKEIKELKIKLELISEIEYLKEELCHKDKEIEEARCIINKQLSDIKDLSAKVCTTPFSSDLY